MVFDVGHQSVGKCHAQITSDLINWNNDGLEDWKDQSLLDNKNENYTKEQVDEYLKDTSSSEIADLVNQQRGYFSQMHVLPKK
jgi:hypothetical protein